MKLVRHKDNDINGDKVVTSGSNQVDLQVEQALLELNELKTEAIKTKNCMSTSAARRPTTTASLSHLGSPSNPGLDSSHGFFSRCTTEQAHLIKPPPQVTVTGDSPENRPSMNKTGMSSSGFHMERGNTHGVLPSVTQQSFF